jgi:hypothetical protein
MSGLERFIGVLPHSRLFARKKPIDLNIRIVFRSSNDKSL